MLELSFYRLLRCIDVLASDFKLLRWGLDVELPHELSFMEVSLLADFLDVGV